MPLTSKGSKILNRMIKGYGSRKKGEQVFYSMINEGKLKGVEGPKKKRKKKGR